MDHKDHDIAVALQLQRMETDIAQLKDAMNSNTKATEDLLQAWNASKGTLGFIKSLSIWAAAIAGGVYSINKLWGH